MRGVFGGYHRGGQKLPWRMLGAVTENVGSYGSSLHALAPRGGVPHFPYFCLEGDNYGLRGGAEGYLLGSARKRLIVACRKGRVTSRVLYHWAQQKGTIRSSGMVAGLCIMLVSGM